MKNFSKYLLGLSLFLALVQCERKGQSASDSVTVSESRKDTLVLSRSTFKDRNLELVQLEEVPFGEAIRTNGLIDVPPNGRAVISALIGGYVKDAPLLVGDRVSKGQRLLTIENMEFVALQQEYLESSEELIYLKSEFERQELLYKEKISSQKKFLQAQSDYNRMQAKYNGLKKKLQMLHINPEHVEAGNLTSTSSIYSPINGSVTRVETSTGSYVSPSDIILEVVNTEHIHLELKVFEKDALKIKKGQRIQFRIPEYSAESFAAFVHLIGKSIGEDRTVMVHGHLEEDQAGRFIPGMYVQADIFTEENMQPALSRTALTEDRDGTYAWQLLEEGSDSYMFKRVRVTPGKESGGFVQIMEQSDINSGSRYLSGNLNRLEE